MGIVVRIGIKVDSGLVCGTNTRRCATGPGQRRWADGLKGLEIRLL